MEDPKPDPGHNDQTKLHQPEHKSDPKDTAHAAANGDGIAAVAVKASPAGSESEPESKPQDSTGPSVQRTASTGSVRKSVHWNPNLVSESTFVSSPEQFRSNSFSSTSINVRGQYAIYMNVYAQLRLYLCMCVCGFLSFVELMGQTGAFDQRQ